MVSRTTCFPSVQILIRELQSGESAKVLLVDERGHEKLPTIKRSAIVAYQPREMFRLVDDVSSYPEFLPWCNATKVLSREQDEVRASIEIRRGAVHKSFSTCNRLRPGKEIEMRLLEGPFKYLEGLWRFDALGEQGCKVSLDLAFEFSSRILNATIGPLFNQIANSMVDAFCQRAQEVYGKR